MAIPPVFFRMTVQNRSKHSHRYVIRVGKRETVLHKCANILDCNSKKRKHSYVGKERPLRQNIVICQKNVVNEPLVERQKIYLTHLHIKLWRIKFRRIALVKVMIFFK